MADVVRSAAELVTYSSGGDAHVPVDVGLK